MVGAQLQPSSELPLHLAVYAHTAAAAVVHTPAPASSALSTVVEEIPASHYYTALFGGPVRVAAYATYGTPQLAENVVSALDGRSAALLSNHGALVVGATLAAAYQQVTYLEYVCEVQLRAMSTGQVVRTLSLEEIARVAGRLSSYGQRPPQR